MKVYVLTEAVADDDCNMYAEVVGVYANKKDATDKLQQMYNEELNWFEDPEGDFYETSFDISEADDISIRRTASIDEMEVI